MTTPNNPHFHVNRRADVEPWNKHPHSDGSLPPRRLRSPCSVGEMTRWRVVSLYDYLFFPRARASPGQPANNN
ncbi:hypothetical protein XA68_17462 [Ophiocordyceps unilateralis]|uniref:Uncharacterized protein n=1 Tax=Ophiocordyceps unilateralis TaxID=268505 RepID=A0A2A9PKK8_OPHUN|nr:hypothetical protein XA68_17462 [Ophiocordyceps unilateralis]